MVLIFLSPLHKASRQLEVHIEARIGALGVSSAEGHLLTYLRGYAPASVGELARVFGHRHSTLTSMLDRLERAKLLRRRSNPDDRRSLLVELAEPGVRLTGRINRLLDDVEAEIRGRVRTRDVQGFQAVMGAVDEVTGVELRKRRAT
jgi:DNA-binding MarR family transcriptional regulator